MKGNRTEAHLRLSLVWMYATFFKDIVLKMFPIAEVDFNSNSRSLAKIRFVRRYVTPHERSIVGLTVHCLLSFPRYS